VKKRPIAGNIKRLIPPDKFFFVPLKGREKLTTKIPIQGAREADNKNSS